MHWLQDAATTDFHEGMTMRRILSRGLLPAALAGLAFGACDGGSDEAQGTTNEGPGVALDVAGGGDTASGTPDDASGGDSTSPDVSVSADTTASPDVSTAADVASDTASAPDTGGTTIDPLALLTYEPTASELAAYPQCTVEDLTLTVHGNKVATLQLGNGGHAGEGLDVDGNAASCAPADDCEDGIDNQLGTLGALVNASLVDSLDSGVIMLVLEFEGFAQAGLGEPFTLKMYTARIDPTDEGCDWQKEECIYNVRADSFDDQCQPLMTFANTTIAPDGSMLAGGPDSKFILSVPLFGLTVKVPVYAARIEATTKTENGIVVGVEGLIAGAVPKSELLGAVEVIPDEEFAQTGFGKDFIVSAIDGIVEDDIDTDGDGVGDGASVGIRFGTIPGKLSGYEIPPAP